MTSHSGSKLDGQMPEATDAHDSNAITCSDTVLAQHRPDGSSSTHKWSCMRGVVALGDAINTVLSPHCPSAEGSVVEVVEPILLLMSAELIPAY